MKFKPQFTKADIRKFIDQQTRNIENAIISRFQLIGEEFVKMARSKTAMQGGFGDITGNLRSSIGYIVVHNGNIIDEDFQTHRTGSEGKGKGQEFAKKVASDYPVGFALIVVAGMEYAAAVENRHHKDVITGSSLIAEAMLKKAIANLKAKIA